MAEGRNESEALVLQGKTPEELIASLRERHGDNIARIIERIDVKSMTAEDESEILRQFHEAGLNGNAEPLWAEIKSKLQQMDIKKDVQKTWLQSLGETASNVGSGIWNTITYPFRKAPVLTTVGLVGLAAYLAYYYGIPLAQFSGEGGDERTQQVGESLRKLTSTPLGGDAPGAGELPAAQGQYPNVTAPRVRLPGR